MKNIKMRVLSGLLLSFVAVIALGSLTFAHEQRDVGTYHLEVGWATEPAIEGQLNGVFLAVNRISANSQPIGGLEKTLKVDVSYVSGNITRTLDINAMEDAQGRYTNAFIPTAPGQYKFRVYGQIEGAAFDQTFLSGPGTFDDVETATAWQFPTEVPAGRELAAAASGADARAGAAQDAASSAKTLAIAGIVLGVIGVLVSIIALMRKR